MYFWYCRILSEKPHIGGQEMNHKLGQDLMNQWKLDGLDHVTMTPYKVLLSYPNETDLNYVELLDGNNETQYKSDLREPSLTPEENKTHVVPPFNAYSAPGDIYVCTTHYRLANYKITNFFLVFRMRR